MLLHRRKAPPKGSSLRLNISIECFFTGKEIVHFAAAYDPIRLRVLKKARGLVKFVDLDERRLANECELIVHRHSLGQEVADSTSSRNL